MRILVNGAKGYMGRVLCDMIREGKRNSSLAGMVSRSGDGVDILPTLTDFTGEADCIIDFSHHAATAELVRYAVERSIPLVVATTGQTAEEMELIHAAAETIPVFCAGNLSMGIAVLTELAKTAAKMFPDADIEIVEQHHNRKVDVPSGTALMLGHAIQEVRPESELLVGRHEQGKRAKQEIGIHSLRMGNTVGIHEVIINTGTQVLSLKHEAQDRALFAEGALAAAEFLQKCVSGFYNMNDLVSEG